MTDQDRISRYSAVYEDLLGFVPPRVQARLKLGQELAPELLRLQESVRQEAMYVDCLDPKTVQLMLWGILLAQLGSGAKWHGVAARRAGATWEELHAVAGLAFLFRGLPAMNLAAEILEDLRATEGIDAA